VPREAIERTGKVALRHVVLARRERGVAILPMGDGLVLHTLHDMREITSPDQLFVELPQARPDREMVALATQRIDRQTARFAPEDMEDRYEIRLRRVIEAKLKGLPPEPEPEPEPEERGNVVDLMAALRRSLGEEAPRSPRRGKVAAAPAKLATKAAAKADAPAKSAPSAKARPAVKARPAAKAKRAAGTASKPSAKNSPGKPKVPPARRCSA